MRNGWARISKCLLYSCPKPGIGFRVGGEASGQRALFKQTHLAVCRSADRLRSLGQPLCGDPVGDCLREVDAAHVIEAIEIGQRSRDLEHAMVCAR
jgi:hypothetical protein